MRRLTYREQSFWVEEFLYTFLVSSSELSIILLYLRLFSSRGFQIQSCGVILVVVLFSISSLVTTGLSCRPIHFVWDGWKGEFEAKCIQAHIQIYALAAINILLDMALVVLPIPQVSHRSLRRRAPADWRS